MLDPFELEEMYGKKGRELVQEVAESEPGQFAAFNVCNLSLFVTTFKLFFFVCPPF